MRQKVQHTLIDMAMEVCPGLKRETLVEMLDEDDLPNHSDLKLTRERAD